MSKITTLEFTGQNGRKYDFSVYPKDTKFKSILAIYAFLKLEENGCYRVLYIGKTTDLSTRFDGHHKWEEATRYGFGYIGVCTDSTILSLDLDEANLIQKYQPRCNDKLKFAP